MTSSDSAEGFPNGPKHELPPDIVALQIRYQGFDGEERDDGVIEIHEDLATDLRDFFEEALVFGFPIARIEPASLYNNDDELLMAGNVTSGYNDRFIAGSETKSLHAQGRAFDVNTLLNPYVRIIDGEPVNLPPGSTWDWGVPGTLHGEHPLVLFMEERGWIWGGHWNPPDYQHFEKPEPSPGTQ